MSQLKWIIPVIILLFSASSIATDRQNIIKVVEIFYQGDHQGSKELRMASLHPQGAYRYVDAKGNYVESKFQFYEGNPDTSYQEEILSIDIYQHVALVRLRLDFKDNPVSEYKLMTLHKSNAGWLITSISWGMGVNIL